MTNETAARVNGLRGVAEVEHRRRPNGGLGFEQQAEALEQAAPPPHPAPPQWHPDAVHHFCKPSNLEGSSPFAMWCRFLKEWVDGAGRQLDYECVECGERISVSLPLPAPPAPEGEK